MKRQQLKKKKIDGIFPGSSFQDKFDPDPVQTGFETLVLTVITIIITTMVIGELVT